VAGCGGLWHDHPGPKEEMLESGNPADFNRFTQVFYVFHEISWVSRVRRLAACGRLCKRNDASIETFARS